MEELMKAYDWKIDEQSILPILETDYEISIIPEYSYYYRENNMIFRSTQPQNIVLNTAIMLNNEPQMYFTFSSEEEFYDFMIEFKKQYRTTEKQIA